MKTLTREWLQAGKDDLDVIQEIVDIEHLTHIVAFHAQQCVEKVFKAVLEEHNKELPKIHNLGTLYGLVEDNLDSETRGEVGVNLLKRLDELYIDSRYPGEFGLLPDGKPTLNDPEPIAKREILKQLIQDQQSMIGKDKYEYRDKVYEIFRF